MNASAIGSLPLFTGIVRAEARKLGTVRSTWWTLLAAVAANVAVGAALGALLPSHLSSHQKSAIDTVRVSLGGLHLSQIAIGMLGVLAITGEYSTGMIRATLTAVPQRRPLLAAKILVLTASTAVTMTVACLGAYLAFQAFLPAGDPMHTTLADPAVLRAVIGAALYLAVLALLGFGLGALLRSSAGATAALLGVLFVPTLLAALLPQNWQDTIGGYLPMNAGDAVYSLRPEAHMLRPWAGFGVFCLYSAVALIAAFVLISRRDA